MQIQRVLVPTALDEASNGLVQYARELATRFRAELHILHVVPDAAHEPWAGQVVGIALDDLTEAWRRDAEERVHECARTCPFGPIRVVPIVRQGDVAEAILGYAAEQRIDLIVLGTSSRGPLAHALRGRTVDRVVRKAACAVVSVPPQALRAPSAQDSSRFEVAS